MEAATQQNNVGVEAERPNERVKGGLDARMTSKASDSPKTLNRSISRYQHLYPASMNAYQSPYISNSTIQPGEKRLENMSGVDLTPEAGPASTGISWHDPHPMFVVILVGPEEVPFGIQKDLLCAQSLYYRQKFAQNQEDKIELVVKLANTDAGTFGYVQNFMFTGGIYDRHGGKMVPDYPILMNVWELATSLGMAPLRVAILDAMAERRRLTGFIPSVPILVEAWEQTEDGSGLRKMLIGWAAEHSKLGFLIPEYFKQEQSKCFTTSLRSNADNRQEFVRTLPQDILSALVMVLSEMPAAPTVPAVPLSAANELVPLPKRPLNTTQDDVQQPRPVNKRARKSATDLAKSNDDDLFEIKPKVKKQARKSEPVRRINRQAEAAGPVEEQKLTPEKDLEYCRDLIKRMISGPGYWTRFVPSFKKPVDPVADNAPNYFDVVKKPMCLNLMQEKMDKGHYTSAAEFEADIRLIFQNCYEYWTPTDAIWKECETFEKFFDNQWAARHSYRGHGPKRIKAETAE